MKETYDRTRMIGIRLHRTLLALFVVGVTTFASESLHALPDGPGIQNNDNKQRRHDTLAETHPGWERAIRKRAQAIIEHHAESDVKRSKLAHFYAQARFADGRMKQGRTVIREALSGKPLVDYYDPSFVLWSLMDCYMRWKDVDGAYTEQLKRKTKAYVAEATEPTEASTYNHHWMLSAGLMLAHQAWGEDISYQWSEGDRSGKEWVMRELEKIVRKGHREILSPTYFKFSFGPILSLYRFSEDPVVRKKALNALDWLTTYQACFFFRGHVAGATRRTYHPGTKRNSYLAPNWLFFGGPRPRWQPDSSVSVEIALSGYRPPVFTRHLATQRSKSFSLFAARPRDRLTTFYNRSYALFSSYMRNNDYGERSAPYHERMHWGIRWMAPPDTPSTFYIKHPVPKFNPDNPVLGDSPFHQVLQDRSTLIGTVRIPEQRPERFRKKSWIQFVYGSYPTGAEAVIDRLEENGRLYLHYETVLIGVHLTREATSTGKRDGERRFKVKPKNGKRHLGYVVETAHPSSFTSGTAEQQLEQFARDCSQRFNTHLKYKLQNDRPTIAYRNLDDRIMELGWRPKGTPSAQRIDNQSLTGFSNSKWPVLKNPWLHQTFGQHRLTVDLNGKKWVFDYNKDGSEALIRAPSKK